MDARRMDAGQRLLGRLRRRHPLGDGLWRADFDRVDRAAGRVLQVLAHRGVVDERLVADLTACRELVWQACLAAVARDPGAAAQVPASDDLAAVHHALSRAATSLAQAAQALVIAADDRSAAQRALAAAADRAHEALRALARTG